MASDSPGVDLPTYSVTYFGPDFDAESILILLCCKGQKYILEVHLADIPAAKDYVAELVRLLKVFRALADEADDKNPNLDWEAQIDVQEWIIQPFRQHLAAAKNIPFAAEQTWTLGQSFFPEISSYRLFANEFGTLTYQEQDVDLEKKTMEIPHLAAPRVITAEQQAELKAFKPDELTVEWNADVFDAPPLSTKVRYGDEEEYFFKAFMVLGDEMMERGETSVTREIKALLKIQQLQSENEPSSHVRIPSIIGYVEHDLDAIAGQIAGLVLQCVDAKESMYFLCKAAQQGIEGVEEPSTARKNKWKQQITEMVAWLHGHGLIWGDAKADNVLIDRDDDAWLIDFGGGFTPGWVDQKRRNSVAGDLQGLERIAAFLNGEPVQDEEEFLLGEIDGDADAEGDACEEDRIYTPSDGSRVGSAGCIEEGNGRGDDLDSGAVDDGPNRPRRKRRRTDDEK